jgi:hypothetical protein
MDHVFMDRNNLPKDEHEAARSIEHNLIMLDMIADEFRQTVDLYLFAHARKSAIMAQRRANMSAPLNARRFGNLPDSGEMIGLIKIAGRNGAVVANGFARIMEAINSTKAPTIWAKADQTERRKGTKLFASEFPTIEGIRTSAAHPGELAKSPTEQQRHRLSKAVRSTSIIAGEGSGVYISDMMHGSPDKLVFGASVMGDFVEYELSMPKDASGPSSTIIVGHFIRWNTHQQSSGEHGGNKATRCFSEIKATVHRGGIT